MTPAVRQEGSSNANKKTIADLKRQAIGNQGSDIKSIKQLVKEQRVLSKEEGDVRVKQWTAKKNPE